MPNVSGQMFYREGYIGDGPPPEHQQNLQRISLDDWGHTRIYDRAEIITKINGKRVVFEGSKMLPLLAKMNDTLKQRHHSYEQEMPIYADADETQRIGKAVFREMHPQLRGYFHILFLLSAEAQKVKRAVTCGDLQLAIRCINTLRGPEAVSITIEKPSTIEKQTRNLRGEDMTPQEETREIEALAKHHNRELLGRSAVSKGWSLSQFREHLLDDISSPAIHTSGDSNSRQFSLGAAIRAELSGDWSEAGYEREMCQEEKRNYVGKARGIVVPSDAVYQTRATMVTSGDVSGVIGDIHLGGRYIDIPREASSVMAAGATMITAPRGNVSIPKLSSDVSATFISENSAITESDLDIDTITMSPKLCAGTSSFSRHVLETSDPRVDALVRANLQFRVTNAIDSAALTGSGVDPNPRGISDTTGIETFTTAGSSTITHAESYEIIGEVASNNIDTAGGVWIINPASAATLASTAKDSGSGLFVYEDGRIAGKRVIESAHCPTTRAFFGVFQHLYIGMFGGMDLVIDPYSSARNGVIQITASQLTDVAVAHPGAFNKVTLTA